jgi:acyl-[acyl-carrier-protein]-phospholipid O-acyltransferase/long-chain-fatty-acid--[acyl-carrier-protein] ligase
MSPTNESVAAVADTESLPIGAVPIVPMPEWPVAWRNLAVSALFQFGKLTGQPLMKDSEPTPGAPAEITGDAAAKGAAALTYLIQKNVPADEKNVGVLLPPSTAGAQLNVALVLAGKVAVNLDVKNVHDPIEECGIKTVITIPELVVALGITLPEGVTVVDVRTVRALSQTDEGLTWITEALTAAATKSPTVVKYFPGVLSGLDDVVTILFSSGSTGKAKGIQLTHRNILSQAVAASLHFGLGTLPGVVVDPQLTAVKRLLACLPFNHALGYTGTVWMPILLELFVVYHKNPNNSEIIGKLCQDESLQALITSPGLWSLWLGRSEPACFSSLVMILLGSQKCPPALSELTYKLLGLYPLEAFGATELSPLVTSNTRIQVRGKGGRQVNGNRIGTVGQPIPGTAVKVVGLETRQLINGRVRYDYYLPLAAEDCAVDLKERLTEERQTEVKAKSGLLWFKGPQVMLGYLNRPEKTAEVLVEGYYCTGDIGYVDEDGFVVITGRVSRFAKIAGEMIPLDTVESVIQRITGLGVTNVHVGRFVLTGGGMDAVRGEKLVVLIYIDPADLEKGSKTKPVPLDVVKAMKGQVPELYMPKARDFKFTDAPFKLSPGAAKVDLTEMQSRTDALFA